jgi:hypothetical protein
VFSFLLVRLLLFVSPGSDGREREGLRASSRFVLVSEIGGNEYTPFSSLLDELKTCRECDV